MCNTSIVLITVLCFSVCGNIIQYVRNKVLKNRIDSLIDRTKANSLLRILLKYGR